MQKGGKLFYFTKEDKMMIELIGLRKNFEGKEGRVEAVRDVELKIEAGEIYGIIGYSGAGKSTLIRCINLLERPTAGKVILQGEDLTTLPEKELRNRRKKIGMIFQHFNLLNSRTIYSNVAYPLKGSGLTKSQEQEKVRRLLNLVGIADKENAYPNQLSGGQKQRVAIARALANDPEVLLCDEATSALDPKTTRSILKLLKELNQNLGLTIVLITHEMTVIKEICDRVSIMEDGRIIESGNVAQVFSSPKAQTTKEFIDTAQNRDKIFDFLTEEANIFDIRPEDVLTRVSYTGHAVGAALISEVSRRFSLDASILYGNLEILSHVPVGELLVLFQGTASNIEKGIDYFTQNKLQVEVIDVEYITRKVSA